MLIPFLNDFEIPDNLIAQWDSEAGDDLRYVEKKAIDYIRANTDWQGGIAAFFNGSSVILAFGQVDDYEKEGFYLG